MPRGSRSNATPDLRPLLLHYIRSQGPDTTIGALLADPVAGPLVRDVTLGELGAGSMPARGPAASDRRSSPSRSGGARGKASTRTAGGREVYDTKVLAAIASAGGPVAAEAVIAKVGGTGLQFRTATKRLLASRKIKRTGKARATRYAAV